MRIVPRTERQCQLNQIQEDLRGIQSGLSSEEALTSEDFQELGEVIADISDMVALMELEEARRTMKSQWRRIRRGPLR